MRKLIIDPASFHGEGGNTLPDRVLAFFFVEGASASQQQYAREMYARFVSRYYADRPCSLAPLLAYQPFRPNAFVLATAFA